MVRYSIRLAALALCLAGVSCSRDAPRDESVLDDAAGSKALVADAEALAGLWVGSWGAGERDGTFFQPVIAEMFIEGDQVQFDGFPNPSPSGTIAVDSSAKRIRITFLPVRGSGFTPAAIEYAYKINGEELTLTYSDKVEVVLRRRPVARSPHANGQVEVVEANGINDAGELLVTQYTTLEIGHPKATRYSPYERSLSTKEATVLLVQESGLKKITLEEARALIREPTPVAIAYRRDDLAPPNQMYELAKELGPPSPDSEALGQTFSRLLRPGTLLFVLSARENVVRP